MPAFYSVGETITFSGSATDVAGGRAAGRRPELGRAHLPLSARGCHTHDLQTLDGRRQRQLRRARSIDYPSLLWISLTATNSHGQAATATVYLYPKTSALTFQTNPHGR